MHTKEALWKTVNFVFIQKTSCPTDTVATPNTHHARSEATLVTLGNTQLYAESQVKPKSI